MIEGEKYILGRKVYFIVIFIIFISSLFLVLIGNNNFLSANIFYNDSGYEQTWELHIKEVESDSVYFRIYEREEKNLSLIPKVFANNRININLNLNTNVNNECDINDENCVNFYDYTEYDSNQTGLIIYPNVINSNQNSKSPNTNSHLIYETSLDIKIYIGEISQDEFYRSWNDLQSVTIFFIEDNLYKITNLKPNTLYTIGMKQGNLVSNTLSFKTDSNFFELSKGDLNQDKKIDEVDLYLLSLFLYTNNNFESFLNILKIQGIDFDMHEREFLILADLNNDDIIDINDLHLLASMVLNSY